MPQYQLVVRRGPRAGETFELKSQTVIIGRDSTADIIINDPEVSRNHCRLILDRSYYLQDLGSTNGTFIDGQRLGGEPVRLANGQIIQLGSNVTLLHQEVETNTEIVSTFAGPPDSPMGSAAVPPSSPPSAGAPPAEPPPVFGQPATPPSSFNEPPPYNPPPAQEQNFAAPPPQPSSPPPLQKKIVPEPLQSGGPVDQARQAYQQQAGGQGRSQQQSGTDGEKKGFLGNIMGGDSDAASGGDNGGMPWSNWTQRQWMIAASTLVLLLLCICCLFILAVVVAVNPEALNLQSGMILPFSFLL